MPSDKDGGQVPVGDMGNEVLLAEFLTAPNDTVEQITAKGIMWVEIMKRMDHGDTGGQPINIVFDGPPGPEGPRFVEVETDDGKSIGIGAMQIGAWYKRSDGMWALRITDLPSRRK